MNRMKAKKLRLRAAQAGKPVKAPVKPVEAPKLSEEPVVAEAPESVSEAPVEAPAEKPKRKRAPRKKKVVSDD